MLVLNIVEVEFGSEVALNLLGLRKSHLLGFNESLLDVSSMLVRTS